MHTNSLVIVHFKALYNQVPQIMRDCGLKCSYIDRFVDMHLQLAFGIAEP
jgi:hypothetical protein